MFAGNDDEDDSFEAFLASKKPATLRASAPAPSVSPAPTVITSVSPAPTVITSSPAPTVITSSGGRVALRQTAPARPVRAVPLAPLRSSKGGATRLTDEQLNYAVGGDACCVVGGTRGEGWALAKQLLGRGADVSVLGRSAPPEQHPRLRYVPCELSTVRGARAAADAVPDVQELRVLVLCVHMAPPRQRTDNGEGLEVSLAVSYVGRRALLERLMARGLPVTCRVFVVGAQGAPTPRANLLDWNAERRYRRAVQWQHASAGNDVLVLGMRERHPMASVWGLAANTRRQGSALVDGVEALHARTPEQWAERVLHIVANEELDRKVFAWNCSGKPLMPSKWLGLDLEANVARVWAVTDSLMEGK